VGGWGPTTGGDRRRPDGPVTAEKCLFAGRACVAAQQNLRSLAEKKKKKKKELRARTLARSRIVALLLVAPSPLHFPSDSKPS